MNKLSKRTGLDNLADSMLWVGLGIAVFFWFFTTLLNFLNTGHFDPLHFINSDIELYNHLAVICLFLLFGSHAQINIKRRKHAEETLVKSEEKYRSILESIEEGYYEINPNAQFLFSNPSLQQMLQIERDALPETKLTDFLSGEHQRQFLTLLAQTQQGSAATTTFESDFQIEKGTKKIIELSISPISQADGQTTGFRGITRDITEKRMLEQNLLQSLKDVKEARTGVILGLAKLAEYRDEDTGRHLERIREYTKVIAYELKNHSDYRDYISDEYIEDLFHSSILHDIGKVGVPDAILLKPGRLTQEEFGIIKTHVIIGGKALSDIDKQFKDQSFLTIAKEIAYYHHERWDGTGYPRGLKKQQTPLSARVVSIADVYDALTSKRCYKEAYDHEQAKEIIISERERAFDPDIVDAFLTCEQEFYRIRQNFHDEE